MNTQRRTFRGRGGPTDGRLPKHNARRRRTPARKPATNKYAEEGAANAHEDNAQDDVLEHEEESSSGEELDWNDIYDDDCDHDNSNNQSLEAAQVEPMPPVQKSPLDEGNSAGSDTSNPCVKEVKHLRKRVQNIQETMQLSNSISNAKTYEGNVLNAVSNCANEWRSIVTHYPPAPNQELDGEVMGGNGNGNATFYLANDIRKAVALEVFQMIQHSIQCGPLAGAKPGYFKRCGGDVAKVVETFLTQVIPYAPALVDRMGFTRKQMDAMETWRKNAQKAAFENKSPSRTALNHQQGKGTGKKAKKKK